MLYTLLSTFCFNAPLALYRVDAHFPRLTSRQFSISQCIWTEDRPPYTPPIDHALLSLVVYPAQVIFLSPDWTQLGLPFIRKVLYHELLLVLTFPICEPHLQFHLKSILSQLSFWAKYLTPGWWFPPLVKPIFRSLFLSSISNGPSARCFISKQ